MVKLQLCCSRGAPHRGGLGKVFRPNRHQVLLAPLDHDRHHKRVESVLVELNRTTGHRFGPTTFETRACKASVIAFGLVDFARPIACTSTSRVTALSIASCTMKKPNRFRNWSANVAARS